MVWARVTRPPIPLVYLDLNHYIQLARASRAAAGHRAGDGRQIKVLPGYVELLDSVRRAKADGKALFPLSGIHFQEVAHRVPSPRQRHDVADMMEELSDFSYLLGRPFLAQLEIAAGLDKMYGTGASYASVPLLGDSALWAFGSKTGFKIVDADGNDLGLERPGDEAYEKNLAEMNYYRERKLLEGPEDHEISDLRKRGYAPEAYLKEICDRLTLERETSRLLDEDTSWRRGRLRDRIAGREIAHEWMGAFVRHLGERAKDGFQHDVRDPVAFSELWAAMPQVQVAVSMKTVYHRDPAREWRTNDIADIDALAVAYAYCDAVLTDKQARSALADSLELRAFGAYLPRNVQAMWQWLEALPTVPNPDEHVLHPAQRQTDLGPSSGRAED
jgi:hypothetical protein